MARRVFYSFHYKPDNWRVSQIRNIGTIEGNPVAHDNEWEKIKQKGESAIQDWIDTQMKGKSTVIVLIGTDTANRKWIKYEIKKGWQDGKGILGIYTHNLKDVYGNQASQGKNPFDVFHYENKLYGTKTPLSSILKVYNPPYSDSKKVYNHIQDNIVDWIEEAWTIRQSYG